MDEGRRNIVLDTAAKEKIVLVVDDMEMNRELLRGLFCEKYRVVQAENGRQAMAILAKARSEVAVVLLDIVMPEMDGFAVLEEMRANNWLKRIPVVLITADQSEAATLRGYEFGVSDVINKPFSPEVVRRRVENTIDLYEHKFRLEHLVERQIAALAAQEEKLRQSNIFMIDTLSTVIEFRNGESGQHIRRIRDITRIFLSELSRRRTEYQMTPQKIEKIANAAALHDIGKIAVPDYILNKPGKLTDEEFAIMKTHTVRGCDILQMLEYVQDRESFGYCYEICRHHHERWDGRGYPDGLAGSRIPIWSQAVSLADVYEALISERVYKAAYTHAQARDMILSGACGAFNPAILECFLSVEARLETEIYPEGLVSEYAVPYAYKAFSPGRKTALLPERTLRLLELEREKYRILSELSGEVVFSYDIRLDVLELSEKYHEMFGREVRVCEAREALRTGSVVHRKDKARLFAQLREITPERPTCRLELRLKTAQGAYEWFEVVLHALQDAEASDACIGYIGKLTNIHARKMETNHWREEARTDPLTGLYNRKALEEAVKEALTQEKQGMGALCFIDVDDFKQINDQRGHLFGDEVLRCVSARIREAFASSALAGRVGGDEFVVYLQGIACEADLRAKAALLSEIFTVPCLRRSDNFQISGSIGIACYPQHGKTYGALLHKADLALYQAKKGQKNQFAIYDYAMQAGAFAAPGCMAH